MEGRNMQSLKNKSCPDVVRLDSPQIVDPRGIIGISLLLQYVINTCWGGDPLYESFARVLNLIIS